MMYITPFLTAYFTVLAFVLGTVLASFLGCLGWRMCNGESVLKGRSHCDSCGHVLETRDLIPILSYLMNKGHCRHCGAKISSINLYGEIIMGLLFAVLTLIFGNPFAPDLLLMLFFIGILYLVTVTDIYEQIIPDSALVVAILVKVVYNVLNHIYEFAPLRIYTIEKTPVWHELLGLLIDGLVVSLPLLILVLIMEKILKKEAMGGGDIKLLFVTGLYLGWARNILVVFFACIIGIIVGVVQQKKMQEDVAVDTSENEEAEVEEQSFYFAFGPSIAVSAVFVLFFGNLILDWYLSMF